MQWKKEVVDLPLVKLSQYLVSGGLFFTLIIQQYSIFIVLLFCGCILFIQDFYFRKIADKIMLENVKGRERLLIEDETSLKFTFFNSGLPIWQASLTVVFDDAVEPLVGDNHHYQSHNEVIIPLTLRTNKKYTVSIPIKARHRGLMKVRKLQLRIPNLFGVGTVFLSLDEPYLEEKIVYPKFHHVLGELYSSSQRLGNVPTPQTLFQDPFSPVGTREYRYGDSFQHIHWKASARSQALHTKVFETTADHSWLVIVNVVEHYSITRDLEEIITGTTYLIEKAFEENHSYSLAINVRSINKRPYYFLPLGSGKEQRRKALDFLSTLSKNDATIPVSVMQQQLLRSGQIPSVSIYIGNETEEVQSGLRLINSKATTIYTLDLSEKQGVLKEWNNNYLQKQG
ncbi:DUF58 domain-containing protein [Bacillus spongiae]|uniref:DUF58 domain-containing protein n=1 Tax=Bacillus spongiae TaxID=2683610 RepID=A0ABU8H9E3_9BACI